MNLTQEEFVLKTLKIHSPEEINKYIDSIKDDKENVKINESEYETEEYENYEDDNR